MSTPSAIGANTLGLDFEKANISTPEAEPGTSPAATESKAPETAQPDAASAEAPPDAPEATPASPSTAEPREKKKPYVNPNRVVTGGSQRDKLSDEQLAERMTRIRQNNEKIRQRKLDVQADEDAFRKTQQAEAEKRARTKKVQEDVNRAREQNALRKMNKLEGREWDAGKNSNDRRPPQVPRAPNGEEGFAAPQGFTPVPLAPDGAPGRGRGRGTPRGRGRGRGRGGGPDGPRPPQQTEDAKGASSVPAAEAPPAAS